MKRLLSSVLLLLSMLPICKGQDRSSEPIVGAFNSYQSSVFQEKVFLHSDRDAYLAGELLWFKVYNTDAATHKFSELSKVIYVELFNDGKKSVLQAKIALKEGKGEGSLFLPVSLPTGNYVLRAYTAWMKNFSSALFFEKIVSVSNPSVAVGVSGPAQSADFDVQFFPEGGSLVGGVENKVAFRVAGRDGRGVEFQGTVVSGRNDTVMRFSPLKFGIGSFTFLPILNETYRAVIKISNQASPIFANLPTAGGLAYNIQLETAGQQITARVNTGPGASRRVYLFVHNRDKAVQLQEGSINNGTVNFSLNSALLPEGVSIFTVFDSDYNPVAERLYFKRPLNQLVAKVSADKTEYARRSKVSLDIETLLGTSAVPADLSLGVFKDEGRNLDSSADIFQYQWLTSELKGRVENPGYYFNTTGPEVNEALDNLLLTHGWRGFQWYEILKDTMPALTVVPEFTGHIVTGTIKAERSGRPAPGIMTFLSTPSKRTQIYASRSDESGKIKFFTKDLIGNEVVVQTNVLQDSTYKIEIDNPFSSSPISGQLPGYVVDQQEAATLKDHYVSVQVQNAFAANELRKFITLDADSSAFYGRPEYVYLLDEFVRFRTTEEVLREYVPAVVLRGQRGNFELIVDRKTPGGIVPTVPLIILDGVPVFDRGKKIIAYDQAKIGKLEVLTRNSFLGDTSFNSIVNFTTLKGNLESFELNPRDLVVDYEGLQLKRKFFSPVYETSEEQSSRIPDMRQLLYWSPDIKTSAEGKSTLDFYTSDQPGTYMIFLQGIGADGTSGSGKATFDVVGPKK